MIPRKIHQVFIQFKQGKPLKDIPIFKQQVDITRIYCNQNDIDYQLWGEEDCKKLLSKYPQYIDLYTNFREEIQRIDFIRYLILYDEGGLYIDCDICPINDIDELFEKDQFFVRWHDDKRQLPYIAVLGSVKNSSLYAEIIQHLIESYEAKSKQDIYNTWIGRFVFQTTGHYMLQRVLKKYPQTERLDILKIHNKKGEVIQGTNPLFEDYNVSYWFKK